LYNVFKQSFKELIGEHAKGKHERETTNNDRLIRVTRKIFDDTKTRLNIK
jgi:hypothetical protein